MSILLLLIYIILALIGLFPFISAINNLKNDSIISPLFKKFFYVFSFFYFSLCVMNINFVISCKYYSLLISKLFKSLAYMFYALNVNFSLITLIIRLYKTFELTIFNLSKKYLFIFLFVVIIDIICSIISSIIVVFWEYPPNIWFIGFILGIISYIIYITTFIIIIRLFVKKLKLFLFKTELNKTNKTKYESIMKIAES